MKIEELEKLKKGAQLMDEINSYKFFIENTEKAMKDSEQIVSGILYTEGENKIRMPLSKEVTLKAIEVAIAEHKANIARLEKEISDLQKELNALVNNE